MCSQSRFVSWSVSFQSAGPQKDDKKGKGKKGKGQDYPKQQKLNQGPKSLAPKNQVQKKPEDHEQLADLGMAEELDKMTGSVLANVGAIFSHDIILSPFLAPPGCIFLKRSFSLSFLFRQKFLWTIIWHWPFGFL